MTSSTEHDLESAWRSYAAAFGERRWTDMFRFMQPNLVNGTKTLSREEFAAHGENVSGMLGKDMSLTVDGVLASNADNCVIGRLYIECTPAKPFLGYPPTGQKIGFFEIHVCWFEDGKLARQTILTDTKAIREQLDNPSQGIPEPDRMTELESVSSGNLDAKELENLYRGYTAALSRTVTADDLSRFVHEEAILHGKKTSLSELAASFQTMFGMLKDTHINIKTLLVDEKKQLIGVQSEGEGSAPVPDDEQNERKVHCPVHALYQIEEGKIRRVWSVTGWDQFQQELKGGDI